MAGEFMDPMWPDDPPPPPDELEVLSEDDSVKILRGSAADWHRSTANQACQYLSDLPELFLDRDRKMMWVDDARGDPPSIQYVIPSTVPDLLGRAEVACQHQVKRGDALVWVFLKAPDVLCQTVVSRRPPHVAWKRFEGFASGPYILPDGTVVQAQGFAPAKGLWLPYAGHVDLPDSGKGMLLARGYSSYDKGREALLRVLSELGEFPWADPEVDPAVWLSYLMTLVTRPAYDHAPLYLFEASRPRSGKDLLFKAAETIAHARAAHRITLADDPNENEKRIATGLLAGHTTIVFSDVKQIGSPLLLSLITEGHNVIIRLLGSNTAIPVPRTLTLGANANNVTFHVPDLVPRTIHLRLDPPTSTPEQTPHKLNQYELLEHFAKMRPLYLAAVFNALRGYLNRKRDPETDPKGIPCGSFPQWATLVRDCLLYYGFPDVLMTQERLRKSVPVGENAALEALFCAWFVMFREQEVTSGRLIMASTNTYGDGDEPDPKRVALASALQGIFDAKPSARKLTAKLASQRDWIGTIGSHRVKLRRKTAHNQEVFALEILP